MSFLPADIDRYNSDVKGWTDGTRADAITQMDALGIQASSQSKSPIPLRKALKTSLRKRDGITTRISFKLPRHAIFRHKGVGRGTTISQVGSTKRTPAPFLNPVIEKNLGTLSDLVADHQGTMIINALIIK